MNVVVIGTGNMALECVKYIHKSFPNDTLAVALTRKNVENKVLADFCQKESLDVIEVDDFHSGDLYDFIERYKTDWIFNINSMILYPDSLLQTPKNGVVNFHNGPLPFYKGLNVCSWAIVNGETRYGVTWHYIKKGEPIDSGKIIHQELFEIKENETALSLIIKCVDVGLECFPKVYRKVSDGYEGTPQAGEGSIYFSKQKPNNGFIDLTWPYSKIKNFMNGLKFSPFPNLFVTPKIDLNGSTYEVTSVSLLQNDRTEQNLLDNERILKCVDSTLLFKLKK